MRTWVRELWRLTVVFGMLAGTSRADGLYSITELGPANPSAAYLNGDGQLDPSGNYLGLLSPADQAAFKAGSFDVFAHPATVTGLPTFYNRDILAPIIEVELRFYRVRIWSQRTTLETARAFRRRPCRTSSASHPDSSWSSQNNPTRWQIHLIQVSSSRVLVTSTLISQAASRTFHSTAPSRASTTIESSRPRSPAGMACRFPRFKERRVRIGGRWCSETLGARMEL